MEIRELVESFKKGEISVYENTEKVLDKIEKNEFNSYISFDREGSLKRAKALDEKRERGEKVGKLFGLPITVKDNISYKEMRMTCASKMLENFTPVYNATVVENLLAEDAIIVAKTNMDEFAMGGTGESSYFGPIKNPLDPEYIPGGSSSGSAASVASGDVLVSLGTDTGGSVREPASYCNIVGYKPSYSLMSRYGVVSMANTLDQVSILGSNVSNVKEVASVISSPDENDMTSILESYDFSAKPYDFKGKKIGVIGDIKEKQNIDPVVQKDYDKAIELIKNLGAEIVDVRLKYADYANAVYNVVMNSEVSSNLSRFDGIRYGFQADNYDSLEDLFVKTRSQGFGEEVQRRIAMGTLYLAASDNQKTYKKGLKLRTLIKEELEKLFENDIDLLITPTTVDLPSKLGERKEDPLSDFKSDQYNVICNLSGLPGLSLPVREGISGSIQIISARFDDAKVLAAGEEFERRRG